MKKIVSILLLFLLCSCGAVRNVTDSPEIRTEYVHLTDSIVITDSVYIKEQVKADTVYLTRDRYRSIYKVKTDTVTTCDTIIIVKTVETPVPYVPDYYKTVSRLFWILVIVGVGVVVIKMKR